MSEHKNAADRLDTGTRLLHLGLACFGLLAWVTGWLADDYKELRHTGFSVHSWVGFGTALFTGLRLLHAVYGALIIIILMIEPLGLGKLYGNIRDYLILWPFDQLKK